MAMSGLSFVVIFFLTNVASVAFSALVFGAAAIAAHGATRVPDDLFIDDSEVGGKGWGRVTARWSARGGSG
jgi:hypothetical protein